MGGHTRQVYPHWKRRIFRARNIGCRFSVFLQILIQLLDHSGCAATENTSLSSVFTTCCEVGCSFCIFLIDPVAKLVRNWTLKKHLAFLVKSVYTNYVFEASMRGDTQDRFTPMGKLQCLEAGTLGAVFRCFYKYRRSF